MNRLLLLSVVVFVVQLGFAQRQLPVIKATSTQVAIRNGQDFHENAWRIVPEANPDVYHSSKVGERITFYTDLDSISVVLEKEKVFDFVILLNGKDSAYTRVAFKDTHLNILKKAHAYDEQQQRTIPEFTYLDKDNEHLKRIRKDFKLDSIAGGGNEVSQMINLMYWVHNIVAHDGGSMNPSLKNAIDLVKVCQTEKRGVNCRMMATILNECYLAMGFKSRMVTCKPRPLQFNDCHVINAVYSEDYGKWLWMDPTFAAYVMNEKGELLGLQEVRERLISGEMLILNPDANWNRQNSQTKEGYLYNYMAKNLYRLEVPAYSNYNTETAKQGKTLEYIELLPLDGINQEPILETQKSKKSGMTYKTYIINNPKQFWEEL